MPATSLGLLTLPIGSGAQAADPKADKAAVTAQTAPPATPADQNAAQTQPPKPTTPPAPAPGGSRIGEIIVTGNKTLSSAYIIAASGHKVGDPCTDQTLSEMMTNLVKTGYFGQHSSDREDWVKVHSEEYNPPNGQCKVIIEVDENDTIRSVEITGSGPIKPEEIRKLIHISPDRGQVYNDQQFLRDIQDIQDLYSKQGYTIVFGQDAGPDPKDPTKLNIPIIVARVAEINIVKNRKTRRSVILREMKTKVGDYYNQFTLDRDRLRLYNLDLFDEVLVETHTLGPGRVGITISLVEKRTGTVNFGVGYSNRQQLIGFAEISESNFRGTGEQISLRWETGTLSRRSSVEFGFTEPWLDKQRTALDLRLYDRTIYRFSNTLQNGIPVNTSSTSNDQYTEQRAGGSITLSRPILRDTLRAAITGRAENVHTDALNLSPENAQIVQDGPIYSLGGSLLRNTRDLDIDPVSGGYDVLTLEVGHANLRPANANVTDGVFGSANFSKSELEGRQYFNLQGPRPKNKPDADRRSLALRLQLGASLGKLPFFEQFFVGGAENLRGYREDRFWGKYKFLGSIEYRHPIARKLKGVLFLDVGDAWGGPYSGVTIAGFKQTGFRPHVGAGFGVRIGTPLGPIRLDFGFGDEGGRTHFSIGNVF